MPDRGPTDSSPTRRFMVETAARASVKMRIMERLLNLFGRKSELRALQEELLDTALDAVPSEAASYFERNSRGGLKVVAARGPVAEKLTGMKLKRGEGVAGACAEDRRTLFVSDADKDPRHAKVLARRLGYPARSLLAVPVYSHGNVLGVIELVNKKGEDTFARHEIELVERIARSAADLTHRER